MEIFNFNIHFQNQLLYCGNIFRFCFFLNLESTCETILSLLNTIFMTYFMKLNSIFCINWISTRNYFIDGFVIYVDYSLLGTIMYRIFNKSTNIARRCFFYITANRTIRYPRVMIFRFVLASARLSTDTFLVNGLYRLLSIFRRRIADEGYWGPEQTSRWSLIRYICKQFYNI